MWEEVVRSAGWGKEWDWWWGLFTIHRNQSKPISAGRDVYSPISSSVLSMNYNHYNLPSLTSILIFIMAPFRLNLKHMQELSDGLCLILNFNLFCSWQGRDLLFDMKIGFLQWWGLFVNICISSSWGFPNSVLYQFRRVIGLTLSTECSIWWIIWASPSCSKISRTYIWLLACLSADPTLTGCDWQAPGHGCWILRHCHMKPLPITNT